MQLSLEARHTIRPAVLVRLGEALCEGARIQPAGWKYMGRVSVCILLRTWWMVAGQFIIMVAGPSIQMCLHVRGCDLVLWSHVAGVNTLWQLWHKLKGPDVMFV